ncbi:MAG: FlgD immunoglobulin-like domain containing protein [Candidatus Cloacimonas sp.]|jgi:hypothetical protein|nr:FlgD immunoglobulin-like domain containing protein [Candidatus Cloacimonas sp.]
MKRLLLVAIALIAMSLNAQITGFANLSYHLEITQVSSNGVVGTLTMTNDHDQDWQMDFPNAEIAEIWVDDNWPIGFQLPMSTMLTIPANQSHIENVSYYRETPLSEGLHIAKAHMADGDHTPVGNYVQFWAGTILNDLTALDWNLNLDEINPNSVTGTLSIHNPSTHLWQRQYNSFPVFYLSVDGSPLGAFMYIDYYTWFTLNPGETKTWVVSHHNYVDGEPANYSVGVHSAQAKVIWDESALLGEPVEFTIQPSSIQDDNLVISKSSIFPNPFSASTSISISSRKAVPARICIYNLKGQKVKDLQDIALTAGENRITWQAVDNSGKKLPNGNYLIRIVAEGKSRLIKALLIR